MLATFIHSACKMRLFLDDTYVGYEGYDKWGWFPRFSEAALRNLCVDNCARVPERQHPPESRMLWEHLLVAPFFESENAFTFRRTFHPIRLLLDGLSYNSHPWRLRCAVNRNFRNSRSMQSITEPFSPFSLRRLDPNGPRVILTDHSLWRCVSLGGGPRRYRCYIFNPIVVIDTVVAATLLEFNEHDDIWHDVFIII